MSRQQIQPGQRNYFLLRYLFFVLAVGVFLYGIYVLLWLTEFVGRHQASLVAETVSLENVDGPSKEPRDTPRKDLETLDTQRLFYNRIPKCGSRTINNILQKLSKPNKFSIDHSTIFRKLSVSETEEKSIVKTFMKKKPPCVFDRHMYFINFTKFGEPSPLFINVIRDPVERIVSRFYFDRMSKRKHMMTKISKGKNTPEWYNKTFDECVQSSDPECLFGEGSLDSYLQMTFFCGQEKFCRSLYDPAVLQRAKMNIEKYYVVVGVLEHMDLTIRILEKAIPQFFKRAYHKYKNPDKEEIHENLNPEKRPVSEESRRRLKEKLRPEYELYDFVLQRLFEQQRKLGVVDNFVPKVGVRVLKLMSPQDESDDFQ